MDDKSSKIALFPFSKRADSKVNSQSIATTTFVAVLSQAVLGSPFYFETTQLIG